MDQTIEKIIVVLIASLSLIGCRPEYNKENPLAVVDKENGNFRLKVTAYPEQRDFAQVAAGAYYVFEVKTKDDHGWKEIMVFRHDDPIPINEDGIKFVTENVAYVFMGWKYAVTTDGGKSWKVWDSSRNPITKGHVIQNVELQENGEGVMQMEEIVGEQLLILYTRDYGISWST